MFALIKKTFKALNSSGSSWQLSGAIVLAMFAGFLPSNSLLLIDLFFIALILNINFGLFLLFSVIFAGIGYIFDPVFESVGYTVLTNESLQGLFTSMYNSALFRWSGFNYTITTGSLVISFILALPMLFIVNKMVRLYRDKIGQKLNEWKFTRWMKLFNDEAKSTSFFRWWGLGVFGSLFAAVAVIVLFIFDPLARLAIEKGLSYSLQTDVSVDDFSSSFSDLSVEISGIQIADNDKLTHNLLQVGSVGFDLGFSALMEKKVMIETMKVDKLAFNAQRKAPAQAYDGTASKSSEESEKETGSKEESSAFSSPFSVPDVDDILKNEKLASVEEANALKADIAATKEKWSKISDELKNSNDVEKIKTDAKKLQDVLKSGNITKIASVKGDIDKLKKQISDLKSKYSTIQSDFDADQKRIQKRITALKSLPQKDIDRLKKKYSLNANGGANLISTLIGGEVGNYIKMGMKYYGMVKPYMGSEKEVEQPTPPRGMGRWITYANHSNTPELVIKKSTVNVVFAKDVLDVVINDISSDQKLYKKPMVLKADAKGSAYKSIKLNVIDDRRSEKAETTFDMNAKEYQLYSMDMGGIALENTRANAIAKGKIIDGSLDATSNIYVLQSRMSMPSQKMMSDILEGISKFTVNINAKGDVQSPSIKVSSDLDKQLSSGLANMASKQLKGFESKLTKGVMGEFTSSKEGLSSDLGDVGSILDSKQSSLNGIDLSSSSSTKPTNLLKKFF